MKPSTQRLLATAVLVLLSIGVWRLGGPSKPEVSTSDPGRETLSSGAASEPSPAPVHRALPPLTARNENGTVTLQKPREKTDKFAGRAVVAQKETVQEGNGVKQVKRVRLVRDTSFKYPLIRVEDELVRGPEGDRLTRQVAMVGDHVLVKLVDARTGDATLLAKLKAEGATIRRKMPSSGTLLVAFPQPDLETVPRVVALLGQMKNLVQYAEPDYIMSANIVPNDTSFGNLWGMHNTGINSGVIDADIDAPEAWALTTGSRSVKVAIIDSGIDQAHPELAPNLWTNPNEIPGNGLDDDGNGYVDDIRGWDFVSDDATPQDDNGHGTHCAGTIGAVGNNAGGVAGVCWNVSLISLKFLNSAGDGTISDGIEAIAYATSLGVTLTSNSWTGGDYSQAMKNVIDAAGNAGVLFVAAAGNNSSYLEFYPEYPASYTSGNLISVSATTRQDGLADFSNYGLVSADLGAPGLDIYSTLPGSGYGYNSGTSMACPHVAGACALLKAFRPSLSHLDVRSLVLKSVDKIPALAGKTVTGGRLNLYNALLASDDVLLTPGNGLASAGPPGGPFTPSSKVYTISNDTQATATWTASADRPWVALTPPGGTLSAGESMTLTVSFTAAVNDLPPGAHAATLTLSNPGTGRTQLRPVSVQVSSRPVYQYNLDTDPGWPRTGEWAFGVPQGGGGNAYGRADPRNGATGSQVFGINLAGDYTAVPGQPQYLTAGPFDLSGHRDTRLRFQRWLNSDYQTWVYATVQVSNDGLIWSNVWNNGTSAISDSAWTPVEYDISPYADEQSAVYVRWGHHVAGIGSYAYSGWNLDDIQIAGAPRHQMQLVLPASVTEGGPAAQAKVTVSPAPITNLTVALVSSRPGQELSLPPAVVIPAGAVEISFDVSALQDTVADGSQAVAITATALDYPLVTASLLVHDDEQAQLSLTLPASLQEGSGEVLGQAFLSLPAPAAAAITVSLQSSDTTELLVPATLTIPQGQTSIPLPLILPEDAIIDGTQSVTVTATVINWPAAQRSLSVTDNEPMHLTVSLPDRRLESAGALPGAGSVTVAGILAAPITVTLAGSDPSELLVPSPLVIPAGSASASFDLQIQDDAVNDGDQTVTVTASSPGFTGGSATMVIADDEVPALPVLPSPANGQNPTRPDLSLGWQYDPNSGGIPDNYQVYFGTVPAPVELIGSTPTPAWVLPLPRLASSTTYYWRVVTQKGAASRQGPVWSFTTPEVGPLHHFTWDPTPAAAALGVPFPVRITAVDEYGIPLPAYAGRTPLTAQIEQPETTTGAGTYPWLYPLAANYHDARTQSIYTPAEIGPAGRLTALAFEVVTPPGQTLSNFTIRLRHTTKTDYLGGGLSWESEEWTTVHAADQTIAAPGWTWFVFTTPFEYDGVRNLMVDFSFNNTAYTTDGATRTTITSDYRTLAFRTDSSFGDPLTWSANLPDALAYNGLTNLRLQRASQEVPLSPETSGSYVHGSWSGQITLLSTGQALQLKAKDPNNPALHGLSNPLDVVVVDDFVLSSEPLFTGGSTNLVSGAALGDGYQYEIQRATQPDFSDAASSGLVAGPQHLFTQLIDGKLYHYRGRGLLHNAAGRWSAVERSRQDATPPTITFTRSTGGFTGLASVDLSGAGSDTVSGIGSLTVNDLVSISTDSFASWGAPSVPLVEGLNTISLSAADKAVPPNVRNLTWVITRISDLEADTDHNGVPALLEYAFQAHGGQARGLLPAMTVAKDPGTGKTHLILSYRRLVLNPSNLVYAVETSTGLDDWQPLDAPVEVLSATATGDGKTELVKVRIHPAMEGQGRRFARVRVETQVP